MVGGVQGALLGFHGPKSPECSLSNRTAENLDYLYQLWCVDRWGDAPSPVAISGHNQGHMGLPGGQSPGSTSVLGVLQPHKVPMEPP